MNRSDREIFRMFILCFFGWNLFYIDKWNGEYILDNLNNEMLDAFPENEIYTICLGGFPNYNVIKEN